ncbi:MAG: hypothetical protein PHN26_07330, partial [Eubacteriaceae bacterium]|nr:hypothetical protein [Eubacteriaceae bacterium]
TITSTVGVTGYRTGDTLLCAVDPSQGANLKTGMPVEMNGQSVGEVVEVASEPVRKSDLTEKITNEYYLNALVKTDYVILVRIDTAHGALDSATGDLVNVTIVLASYKPIQFLLSSGSAS